MLFRGMLAGVGGEGTLALGEGGSKGAYFSNPPS